MKSLKIIKLVFFIISSALVLVFAGFLVDHLKHFISALLLAYGIVGVIDFIIKKDKDCFQKTDFYFALLEILLGVVSFLFITSFETICVVWAMWSIFRESIEMQKIASEKINTFLAGISVVESVAVIALSVILIIYPGTEHAITHTYLLCVELILAGSIPVLNQYVFKNKAEIA